MNKTSSMFMGVAAGVLFLVSMLILGTADAGDRLGTAGTGNTHAADSGQSHWVNPNHGNGSIGNCSKDGKFCWNITIGNDGYNHYPTFPVEFHGAGARHLIANGQIEFANMNGFGVFYLGVRSSYDGRPYDCTVNVPLRQYHCISHNY